MIIMRKYSAQRMIQVVILANAEFAISRECFAGIPFK